MQVIAQTQVLTDTIQFGPLLLTGKASDTFFTLLSTLIGAIIGGTIAFLNSSRVETQKWKREQQKAYKEQQRDALKATLRWVEPLENAVIRAWSVSNSYANGTLDWHGFYKKYPDVLTQLRQLELEEHQRVFLPENAYKRGMEIMWGLEKLKDVSVSVPLHSEGKESFEQRFAIIKELETKLKDYRVWLHDEYKRTFQ